MKLILFVLTVFIINNAFAQEIVKMQRDDAINALNLAVSKLIEENKEFRKSLDALKPNSQIIKGDNIIEINNGSINSDSLNEQSSYVVVSNIANVYDSIGDKGKIKIKYYIGEKFNASSIDNVWLYIKNTGYIKKTDVKNLNSIKMTKIILQQAKNIRMKPEIQKDTLLGVLPAGKEVEFYEYPFKKYWYLTKESNFIYKPRD